MKNFNLVGLKMIKRHLTYIISLFILSLSLLVVFTPSQAAAQNTSDIFSRFKKEMPKLELLSEEEFIKETRPEHKRPYDQDSLEYSIRIPKGWEESEDRSSSNFILSEKLFLELNTFYGKPSISGRSRLEIQALNIDSNLTAEQWYLKYILEGGYTTEGFVVHNEDRVESLMIVMEKDLSFWLRTLVEINGSRIIMLRYYVPIQNINAEAVMQSMVISSFKVTNKLPRVPNEMKTYRFLDVAEIKYPVDWKVFAKPFRSVDRMYATIIKSSDQGRNAYASRGKLDVSVISFVENSSLIEEVENYKKRVEASGMLIGEKLDESYEFEYAEGMDFTLTEVYKGVDSSNNLDEYEFWYTVMVGGNYYYMAMLMTPSRNEDFLAWAHNTQNYKELLPHFKPMPGAFISRD